MENEIGSKIVVDEEDSMDRKKFVLPKRVDERSDFSMAKLASISECGSLISVISDSDCDTPSTVLPNPMPPKNTDPEHGTCGAETSEPPLPPIPKTYNTADMVNIKHRRCCLGTDCIGTIFCASLALVALFYSLYWFVSGHRMPSDANPNIILTCVKPEISRSHGGQLMLNYTLNVEFEPPTSVVSANYHITVYDEHLHYIGTSALNLLQTSSVNDNQVFTQIVKGIGSVGVSLPFLVHIPLSHTILAVFSWEEVDYTHCNKTSCPWSPKNHTIFLDVECKIAKRW